MHALHNIHAALARHQPISPRPPVAADGVALGALDMRDWFDTIQAVDELVLGTIADGLYELQHESRFVVTDQFRPGTGVRGPRQRLAGHARARQALRAPRGCNVEGDSPAAGSAPTIGARPVAILESRNSFEERTYSVGRASWAVFRSPRSPRPTRIGVSPAPMGAGSAS